MGGGHPCCCDGASSGCDVMEKTFDGLTDNDVYDAVLDSDVVSATQEWIVDSDGIRHDGSATQPADLRWNSSALGGANRCEFDVKLTGPSDIRVNNMVEFFVDSTGGTTFPRQRGGTLLETDFIWPFNEFVRIEVGDAKYTITMLVNGVPIYSVNSPVHNCNHVNMQFETITPVRNPIYLDRAACFEVEECVSGCRQMPRFHYLQHLGNIPADGLKIEFGTDILQLPSNGIFDLTFTDPGIAGAHHQWQGSFRYTDVTGINYEMTQILLFPYDGHQLQADVSIRNVDFGIPGQLQYRTGALKPEQDVPIDLFFGSAVVAEIRLA